MAPTLPVLVVLLLLVGSGQALMVEIGVGEDFCLSFDGKNLSVFEELAAKRAKELPFWGLESGKDEEVQEERGGAGENQKEEKGGGDREAPAVQFSYQVVEGGYMDIDVEVFNPQGKTLLKEEKKQVGKVRLKTAQKGELYTVCLSNKGATKDSKLVDFTLVSSWALVTLGEHLYPIEDTILKIENSVRALNDEISFIFIQESFQQSTTEETFDRLTYATILEGVALIIVNFWQIRSLQHFFEVKRYL